MRRAPLAALCVLALVLAAQPRPSHGQNQVTCDSTVHSKPDGAWRTHLWRLSRFWSRQAPNCPESFGLQQAAASSQEWVQGALPAALGAKWLVGLSLAVVALTAALAACGYKLVRLQQELCRLVEQQQQQRRRQDAVEGEQRLGETLPAGQAARKPAPVPAHRRRGVDSPDDSAMLRSGNSSNSSYDGHKSVNLSRQGSGGSTGQPTPRFAPPSEFMSPFQMAAAQRRTSGFGHSPSLSPPTSTTPRSSLSPGGTLLGSRPPRLPRDLGALPPLPPGHCPSPVEGPRSSNAGSESCSLSPYASGVFERQMSALPELMALVAAYQASAAAADASPPPSAASSHDSASDHVLLSGEGLGLPNPLLSHLVDPSAVQYLHGPDGRLEQLGAGASSRVYKALFNGEVVAAKEIEVGSSAEMRESFVTEALLLQNLRHPNIIGFFGLSLTADRGVVLLEYAEGRDLHSAVQLTAAGSSERLFGWRRRGRRVAYEVAKALNYLHSRGVSHMDVKSGNVLLTASGEARLSDVGLSRHAAFGGSAATDVKGIGTFAWMAPELLLDAEGCDTYKCDVYSYGVLLWEIITGERPLRGNLRLPRVPEECPREAADLTMRCLSQDPSARPTAAQLVQELGMLLLKRAFAADRTTTSLARARSSTAAAADSFAMRMSADGVPLRTIRTEESAGSLRRSVSFNYPLLAAAAQGFEQPSAAARLAAAQPDLQPEPQPQQEPELQQLDFRPHPVRL